MIKICDKSLLKLLKRSNITPMHKENDKQLVQNYRSISLLPTFGKFEKTIFNKIYHFQLEQKLLYPNQSGFRPSDSCINQLLRRTHETFEAFTVIQFLRLDQSF